MSQHSSHGGNNDCSESFAQQNLEVNMNPEKITSSTPVVQTSKASNVPVNKGTTHIFYKTRMSHTFVKGNCRKGDGCTFAHGPHDLRQPPPNWQEIVKDNLRGGNGNGSCNDDKVEAPIDIGKTRETTIVNIQTVVDHGQGQLGPNQVAIGTMNTDPNGFCASTRGSYWKTRLCGKWETTGKCVFANDCRFAHGSEEVNTPVGRAKSEGNAHWGPYASGSVQLNRVHGTTTEERATGLGNIVHGQQAEHKTRGFLKLANKKLNRIYGDWIDDEEVESN